MDLTSNSILTVPSVQLPLLALDSFCILCASLVSTSGTLKMVVLDEVGIRPCLRGDYCLAPDEAQILQLQIVQSSRNLIHVETFWDIWGYKQVRSSQMISKTRRLIQSSEMHILTGKYAQRWIQKTERLFVVLGEVVRSTCADHLASFYRMTNQLHGKTSPSPTRDA